MEVGGRENVRFGDFEFDLRSGKLFRGGRPVKVQPQPLRVLAVLLESAGATVSRESLRSRVWGDATLISLPAAGLASADAGTSAIIRPIPISETMNADWPTEPPRSTAVRTMTGSIAPLPIS